jgi:hypothetical protein
MVSPSIKEWDTRNLPATHGSYVPAVELAAFHKSGGGLSSVLHSIPYRSVKLNREENWM